MRPLAALVLILSASCGDVPEEDDIPKGARCNFTASGQIVCTLTDDPPTDQSSVDLSSFLSGTKQPVQNECDGLHSDWPNCVHVDQFDAAHLAGYVGENIFSWISLTNDCDFDIGVDNIQHTLTGGKANAEFFLTPVGVTSVAAGETIGFELEWTPGVGNLAYGSGESEFRTASGALRVYRSSLTDWDAQIPIYVKAVAIEPACPVAQMDVTLEIFDGAESIYEMIDGKTTISIDSKLLLSANKSYSQLPGKSVMSFEWSIKPHMYVGQPAPSFSPSDSVSNTSVQFDMCGEYSIALTVADYLRFSCKPDRFTVIVCE